MSFPSLNKMTNKAVRDEKEIIYSNPARPLDFSFKYVKYMEDLIKLEPRNGVRKSLEENNVGKGDEEKKKVQNTNTQNLNPNAKIKKLYY